MGENIESKEIETVKQCAVPGPAQGFLDDQTCPNPTECE